MNSRTITLTFVSLLFFLMVFPRAAAFGTTLTSCTIEAIDQAGQRLTIHTVAGDTWTLPVANADILQGLAKGDRVTVELGPDERITKIVKIVSAVESRRLFVNIRR
ncbi:MAG: hypothetical protein ACREJU_06005 [Nitrospiraceae bacterium]